VTKIALKVLESPPFYKKEVDLWSDDLSRDGHSLHYVVSNPDSFRPELPAYFISRYTQKGQVVLDPFCGYGTTALEANLLGRSAIASDLNPLAARICAAKLAPADITEVTLRLQKMNLSRPINLGLYNKVFVPFFDVSTFRELMNLKSAIKEGGDRIDRFIELIALSLLHGHTAGYFSVYTFPQVSVMPDEQEKLNQKRRQSPDFRAVVPRVIRKAASVLRDGSFSLTKGVQNRVSICDARDMSHVESGSVDLVVTAPPLPTLGSRISESWLKFWFSDLPLRGLEEKLFQSGVMQGWLQFMNEALLEMARVVKPGARAVLDMRELRLDGHLVHPDEELIAMISAQLGRFWEVECLLIHRPGFAKLKDCTMERDQAKLTKRNRMVVLRRK
jgi:hypothetical protein